MAGILSYRTYQREFMPWELYVCLIALVTVSIQDAIAKHKRKKVIEANKTKLAERKTD